MSSSISSSARRGADSAVGSIRVCLRAASAIGILRPIASISIHPRIDGAYERRHNCDRCSARSTALRRSGETIARDARNTKNYHRLDKRMALADLRQGLGHALIVYLIRYVQDADARFGTTFAIRSARQASGACILNWSVLADRARAVRAALSVPDWEAAITMVAVGRPPERFLVAAQPRPDPGRLMRVVSLDGRRPA